MLVETNNQLSELKSMEITEIKKKKSLVRKDDGVHKKKKNQIVWFELVEGPVSPTWELIIPL